MVRAKYAPLAFIGVEELPQAARMSRIESCYEMAKARLPHGTLRIAAVGKFHEINKHLRTPSLDTLAQVEVADVGAGDEVVAIYRDSLNDHGYGRVAVVGNDGTTYDLADQFMMLAGLETEVRDMQSIMAQLKSSEVPLSPDELTLRLITLQDHIHQLSDLRTANGFSHLENEVYGFAALFCHSFSLSLQDYLKRTGQQPDLGEFNVMVQLYRMVQESGFLEMEQEYRSPRGVNLPVYFNPRLKPKDLKNGV